MRLLNIESSPRGSRSASIAVTSAFLEAYRQACLGVMVDTLNVWEEKLPDFDQEVDGRIRVDGRGLLLGGGNTIGTNGNASVFATLVCEATPPFTQFSTNITGVPLAANGDFRIDDVLMPAPPAECGSPVLLIRVTPSGAWFAAGIPKLD
jgi:hypothetical protein